MMIRIIRQEVNPMNEQELIDGLGQLTRGHPDKMHAAADALLLEYIGNDAITDAFERVPKPLSFGKRRRGKRGMVGRHAVLYARWSPRRDEDGVASAEHQLADLREFCGHNGITVIAEFRDEALSGGDLDRPGLWDAIDALKPGHVLLVRSYDRLSREDREAGWLMVEIESRGAECFSITENRDLASSPIANFTRDMMFLLGRMEREQIRSRTRRAMLRHQHNGLLMSSAMRTPYGTREGEPNIITQADGSKVEQRTLETDPDEQAVLEQITAWHAESKGLREICRLLAEQGITCRGGRWHHTTIKGILRRAGMLHGQEA